MRQGHNHVVVGGFIGSATQRRASAQRLALGRNRVAVVGDDADVGGNHDGDRDRQNPCPHPVNSVNPVKKDGKRQDLQDFAGFQSLNAIGFTVVSKKGCQYYQANQRTNVTLADNSQWWYQYDALGQVNSGKRYWPDTSAVLAP